LDDGPVLQDATKAGYRLAERYINNNDPDSTDQEPRDLRGVTARRFRLQVNGMKRASHNVYSETLQSSKLD